MKKAFLLSPLIAALVFAVPEAWQQIREPGPGYVPVLNELLLVLFGYLAAAVANAAMIVPLCMLVRLKTPGPIAGIVLAIFLALLVTTVAYAFEVFDYKTSILHPAYLYTAHTPVAADAAVVLFSGQFGPEAGRRESGAGIAGIGW